VVFADAASGGHAAHARVNFVGDGDRFAILQSAQGADGRWTPAVSTGWDGDTAWRIDQSGTLLTHWASPQPSQPGVLANPLYLAASFLSHDLARPGCVTTAADVSSPQAWDAAMVRATTDENGTIAISFTEEAAAGIASAVGAGDPGASRMRGGWFELVPTAGDGFPIDLLVLKSSAGETLMEVRFTGEVVASEHGHARSWPGRVVCSMMESGRTVMEVAYDLERVTHVAGGSAHCGPPIGGVEVIIDGDAPMPPA